MLGWVGATAEGVCTDGGLTVGMLGILTGGLTGGTGSGGAPTTGGDVGGLGGLGELGGLGVDGGGRPVSTGSCALVCEPVGLVLGVLAGWFIEMGVRLAL
jgi:hypothetical protein